jgi:hypothetical protein
VSAAETRAFRSPLAPLLLTPAVLFIHGFHPFAGDAGIYVAGIRHLLDPALYPVNAAFVTAFTQQSIFAHTLAFGVRLTHILLPWILLVAHLLSIALFLAAARALAARVFLSEAARTCAVLLAAAAFTLPVAGTALPLMDPYVTARSFSTPLALFAVGACLGRRWLSMAAFLLAASLLHPLMGGYATALVILLTLILCGRPRTAAALCLTTFLAAAAAVHYARSAPWPSAYSEAVSLPQRSFLFLARWQWYEILGLVLPLLLFALALRKCGRATPVGALCFACILQGLTAAFIAALLVPTAGPFLLVPLQVLRSFHILYSVGVVLCAAPLAALATRSRVAAAAVVLVICAAMFAAQRASWPGSQSIEWPGRQPSNPYHQAFLWIRGNTPRDAIFAFNPQLVYETGEDEQGFRAIAERDHLADDKDAGVVAVVPSLADRWAAQRNTENALDTMTDEQRRTALTSRGATWLLLPPTAQTNFPCPWLNSVAKVCRMSP